MILRDCMLYAGIRTSRKFARLSWFQRDFFYGLLHAAWPAGRFETDVEVLRAALYGPLLKKVPPRDVQEALAECYRIGLVKLWTDDNGRGWGEVINYRQHGLRKRKPSADADPPPDPGLFTTPPPDPIQSEGLKEGEGEVTPPAPPARSQLGKLVSESQDAWILRLRRDWPAADITMELLNAERDRRKAGKNLQRDWFERHWLPKCSPAVSFATASPDGKLAVPEPEAWSLYLKDQYEGKGFGGDAERYTWENMPRAWQERIEREMRGRKTA